MSFSTTSTSILSSNLVSAPLATNTLSPPLTPHSFYYSPDSAGARSTNNHLIPITLPSPIASPTSATSSTQQPAARSTTIVPPRRPLASQVNSPLASKPSLSLTLASSSSDTSLSDFQFSSSGSPPSGHGQLELVSNSTLAKTSVARKPLFNTPVPTMTTILQPLLHHKLPPLPRQHSLPITSSQGSTSSTSSDASSSLSLTAASSGAFGRIDSGHSFSAASSTSRTLLMPPTQTVSIRTRTAITKQLNHIPDPQTTPILNVDHFTSEFADPGTQRERIISTVADPQKSGLVASHSSSPSLAHIIANSSNPSSHLSSEFLPALQQPKSTNTLVSQSDSLANNQASSHQATRAHHRQHLSVEAGTSTPSPCGSPLLAPRYSLENRPASYVDLLNTNYAQQIAPTPNLDNSFLRRNVGMNASLLDAAKTLEMYSANVAKTNDQAIQYEFAVYMVQSALDLPSHADRDTKDSVSSSGSSKRSTTSSSSTPNLQREDLLRTAKSILVKLGDKGHPFAQYYLGDGYASGLFNKGKEDYDRAFPLFVAAAKRGHAEAGYRTALCYEFGWGCQKNYQKAAYNYRVAASKGHPGAATRFGLACIHNSMGMHGKYRDGVTWLKRAVQSADMQYNSAPYELAKLHENGFGDDIFKDEGYAAQLFTKSANLGHADANLVMGKAYEHGLLTCPQDAALSIHYYTGAADANEPEAMMALCAWYLFGAQPILDKDEHEAFAWATMAAELGYAKAEYAVGYFKEAGMGCTQDTVGANMYYWRSAQQGDERAKARMAAIQTAAAGGSAQTRDLHKGKKGLFSKLGL